jgi:hypothetical protein
MPFSVQKKGFDHPDLTFAPHCSYISSKASERSPGLEYRLRLNYGGMEDSAEGILEKDCITAYAWGVRFCCHQPGAAGE